MAQALPAWWDGETAIRLSCVHRHVPERANGKPVSASAVYSWTVAGLHGVVLRRFRSGGQWCTTLQEIVRWQQRLTDT